MGGGILSGVFWGGLVSAAGLVMLSLLAPLPQEAPGRAAVPTLAVPESAPDPVPDLSDARGPVVRAVPELQAPAAQSSQPSAPEPKTAAVGTTASAPVPDAATDRQTVAETAQNQPATEVSVPAGSEFRRERPDTAPALPLTDRAPVKRLVEAPQPSSPSAIPSTDTAPLASPQTTGTSVAALANPPAQSAGPKFLAVSTDDVLPAPQPTEPQVAAGDRLPQTDLNTPTPPSTQVQVETSTLKGTAPAASPAAIAQPSAPTIASGVPSETPSALSAGTVLNAGSGEAVLRVSPGRVVGTDVSAGADTAPATVGVVVAADSAAATRETVTAPVAAAEDTEQSPVATASPTVDAGTVMANDAPATEVADVAAADLTTPSTTDQIVAGTDGDAAPATAPDAIVSTPSNGADAIAAGETTDQATQAEGDVAQIRLDADKEVVVGQVIPPVVSDRSPSADRIGVRVGTFTDRQTAATNTPAVAVTQAETPAATANQASLDALTRNAAVFDASADRPLFSVILVDVGAEGLDQETLTTFTFPVTFAVDPTNPDAADVAKRYRAAGFEVLILAAGIPDGATPQDIEVTLGSYLRQIPEAIGVIDLKTGGFATSQSLTQQAVSVLKEDGHGLVLYEGGLNRAKQIADRENLFAGLAFRRLDDGGESGSTIRRYLDRAAFKAGQDGAVIMVGRSLPNTVTALFEWALTNRAGQVAMAPVSAVLRAVNG